MIGIDIRMPKRCGECPIGLSLLGTDVFYCPAIRQGTYEGCDKNRHPDCPLHPLDNKIRVGDEVYNNIVGFNGIVTFVWPDGDVDVVAENGRAITWGKGDSIERTGRHFDEIATLLWKMRGEDDA